MYQLISGIAIECHAFAHRVISETVANFLESHHQIEVKNNKPDWYSRDLEILLQNLLLNTHCTAKYTKRFGEYLEGE